MPVIETSGDTSKSGAGGRERLITEGYAHIKVTVSELKTTKNGHPQVVMTNELIAHEQNPRDAGRKATIFQVMAGQSAPYIKRMLDAFGYEALDASANPQMVQGARRYIMWPDKIIWDTDTIVGCIGRVECYHEEYDKKWSEKWRNWGPSQYAPQPGHPATFQGGAPGQGVPYQAPPQQQYAPLPQGAPQGPYAAAPFVPGAGSPPPRR